MDNKNNGLQKELDSILINNLLDLDESEITKCEAIEELIPKYGWDSMQDALIHILLDDMRPEWDWNVSAQVLWGAILDNRKINGNVVIALAYYRLRPDKGSCENNLAWSIASRIKSVEYLSSYNPMTDTNIIEEQKRLNIYGKVGYK